MTPAPAEGREEPGPWTDERVVAASCLLAFAVAVFVALVPLGGVPHVTDEVVYTLQSRLFAAGLRAGPAADNASMVQYPFWVAAPASYAVFPPGWPALLSLGERLRLPWLVNPLLGASLPWLTWLFARCYVDRPTARLAALIAALSPGIWLLSGSRMAHTSVLVALLGAAVVVARREERAWPWWLAGLGIAYAALARPFDAFLVGIPLILLGRRLPLLVLPGLAALLILWDNNALTGDPYNFPVNAWFDDFVRDWDRPPGCNRLGFGETVGCMPTFGTWGHTPAKALSIALSSAARLDRLLLGVPGSLVATCAGMWALRERRLPLLLIPLVVLGYACYWSLGMAYGARFWHLLYILLPTWTAAGLVTLLRKRAWLFAAVLPLVGGSFVLRDLADRYWCVDPGVAELLRAEGIDQGVVFLEGAGLRTMHWDALGVPAFVCDAALEAGDGLWLNDPSELSGGLQVRHALGSDEQTGAYLDALHPDAPAWILEHDIPRDTRTLRRLR